MPAIKARKRTGEAAKLKTATKVLYKCIPFGDAESKAGALTLNISPIMGKNFRRYFK